MEVIFLLDVKGYYTQLPRQHSTDRGTPHRSMEHNREGGGDKYAQIISDKGTKGMQSCYSNCTSRAKQNKTKTTQNSQIYTKVNLK